MPLQGNISSFGVSEILQLISHQGKTGSLEVETADGVARLRFRDGRLLEAWPDRRMPAELLGTLLVRSGLITSAQLEHALRVQRQSLRRVGDILVASGALRAEDFQTVLSLQHRETAYRLLRLRQGKFRFVPEAVEAEEGVSVPLEVAELLMEGFRQIDEWPRILERVSSGQSVFRRTSASPEEELTPAERDVYRLVDGSLTVRDVVDRARLGQFAAWEALAGLSEKGLVVPVGTARRGGREAARRGPGWLPDFLLGTGLALLAAALLGVFAGQGLRGWGRLVQAGAEGRAEAARVAERGRSWGEGESGGVGLPSLREERRDTGPADALDAAGGGN
ncbi:MAG: DUF4388 domain-containing protein [Deferrisomatales bacterium]